NIQSGEVSYRKGCQVGIFFPQGLSPGEMDISISFGPDYYHENTGSGIIAGGISALVTIIASILVYKSMSRESEVLLLEAGGREYALGGEGGDLSDAYLRISKIVIPRMKENTGPENMRPGVTLGKDLIDEDEAKAIGEQLKRRPGGSGKMIVHQCPECMGTELYFESGFMTGYKYHCKNCDYVGSFVIEKQVDFDR
ncbi:MAG: hypothetical protein JW939_02725, partial [Candidatus Thermoplasmatota archaeon]|nr:hypothetical protein [Candidatus Thermoplasmatota archaeon]